MRRKERRPVADSGKQVYVVRIYRRGDDPSRSLVGIVEEVATGKRTPFRSGNELLERLQDACPSRTPFDKAENGDNGR